jgi:CubicO group peptidase (beta-lactamase class C family)
VKLRKPNNSGPCGPRVALLLLLWALGAALAGCRGPQPSVLPEASGSAPAPAVLLAPIRTPTRTVPPAPGETPMATELPLPSPTPTPTVPPAPGETPMATELPLPSPTPTPTAPPVPGETPASRPYWPTQGWRTAAPAEQGMDAGKLALMLDAVRQQNLDLHSLLVIRNGYIVSETYFGSNAPDTRHEMWSVTKSFIATLVGIAIDKGLIAGVERPVGDFYPDRSFANWDSAKQAMTLENILTMTTGLDWTEEDATFRKLYVSRDWVKFVMDEPMRSQPGSEFLYCSGCSHLLSAIIQRQSGMNTRDFARRELFGPLGIRDVAWDSDTTGIPIGGWGMKLTPRDMAKLGYLYLHDGMWDGRQVVSGDWVKAATRRHTASDTDLGYGYHWWTYPRWGAYAALGRYGQTIFVVPDLNLIVVTTAALDGHDPIFDLIDRYIVPAVGPS